jgi:hypothetical protein
MVAPEHYSSMHTLWNIGYKVKSALPINEEILWIALLTSDNIDTLINCFQRQSTKCFQKMGFAKVRDISCGLKATESA